MSIPDSPGGTSPSRVGSKAVPPAASRFKQLRDYPLAAQFCRALARDGGLAEDESSAILDIEGRSMNFAPGAVIARENELSRPLLILSGWAMVQRILPDGNRRIFEFKLPGDTVGPFPIRNLPRSVSTVAITDVSALDITDVNRAIAEEESAKLRRAIEAAESRAQGRLYEQIIRLGNRTAHQQIADFLLEFVERLCPGAASARVPFPLTQEVIGDALGLTSIHVNRTLRRLRAEKLALVSDRWLWVPYVAQLRAAAESDDKSAGPKKIVCVLTTISAAKDDAE